MIESSELCCFPKSGSKVFHEKFSFIQVKDHFETNLNQGEIRKDRKLMSPIEFILPQFNGKAPIKIYSNKLSDKQKIVNFWIKYLYFVQNTIEISSILINAAEINMIMILDGLISKMECGEEALKVVEPNTTYTLSHRLSKIKAEIQKGYKDLFNEFLKEIDVLESLVSRCTHLICDADASEEDLKKLLEEYSKHINDLRNLTSKCEDYGASIGKSISGLRSTHVLKNSFAYLRKLEGEDLEEVRRAFAIMDVLSEDSWEETRPLVMAEIDGCELLVGKAVVTLQAFDLVRQIIEHRISESDTIIPSVLDNSFIKQELIDQIKKRFRVFGNGPRKSLFRILSS